MKNRYKIVYSYKWCCITYNGIFILDTKTNKIVGELLNKTVEKYFKKILDKN